jgi:hypothetical protein
MSQQEKLENNFEFDVGQPSEIDGSFTSRLTLRKRFDCSRAHLYRRGRFEQG